MRELDVSELLKEAKGCYLCKKPRCSNNCPIATPIPEVIKLYKENKIKEAGEVLFNNNPLSVLCSIVCPHENTCYGNCIKKIKSEPVKFYEIEKYISDIYIENLVLRPKANLDDKVAIIGSGPSGITLAIILAKRGYKVTIFEKNAQIGGVLRYGIPEFRLPREKLDKLEEILINLGVKIRYNTLVGPIITLDKLLSDDYSAVFIGTGVWNPKSLNIKGETLGNSHYAIDYLKAPTSYNLGDRVIVIGAGNVAMDASRTAKYYGSKEVTVVYRKGYENMTATKAEINDAKEDNVKFELYKSPIEITEEGVVFVDIVKEKNEKGEIVFKEMQNSQKLIKADSIIIAISQEAKNNIVINTKNLKTYKNGCLVTDDKGHTTREGVFASGDVVTGAKTVVEAVANAKKIANTIDDYLKNKKIIKDGMIRDIL